ncbi:MAG: helix-turn-helix domain-containing protein [Alphaproteobacteria bacterium]|jgi:transcriptional regulator with XRE-family HTH domain|nr:helix-turn-helix domain-containing protein [Alphaproteobacteria bacterium]
MTPFGVKMRELRAAKKRTMQQQADFLGVTPAYLSALERGRKGRPSPALVDQICAWLGLIWDQAEELKMLAGLSHPAPRIRSGRLAPPAILLANRLAQNIDRLDDTACQRLDKALRAELEGGSIADNLPQEIEEK